MRGHQSSGARAPEFWCPFKLKTGFFCFNLKNGLQEYQFLFFLVYLCVPDISLFYLNTASINAITPSRKSPKKCRGTKVLVPGHQNSGALSSLKQVFCFNLKNGHQEYQFFFFPKCIYVFLTFPGFIETLPA